VTATDSRTNETREVELDVTLKTAWTLSPRSDGGADILAVTSDGHAEANAPAMILIRYAFDGKRWVRFARTESGFWGSDREFPAPSRFPSAESSNSVNIPNRMPPVRGAELFKACGTAQSVNDNLSCLENCPEFSEFRAAWPKVPNGDVNQSIHAVWLIRVIDAATKGDPELRQLLDRLSVRVPSGMDAASQAPIRALLSAVDAATLRDEDVQFACQVTGLSPNGTTVEQKLMAVGLVVLQVHAVHARNLLD
jgi:hypothetical protein